MDFLTSFDILIFDISLKPPQPVTGLFFLLKSTKSDIIQPNWHINRRILHHNSLFLLKTVDSTAPIVAGYALIGSNELRNHSDEDSSSDESQEEDEMEASQETDGSSGILGFASLICLECISGGIWKALQWAPWAVHCQWVICRGHIRLLKNIFCKIFQWMLLWENWPETQISQFFMICGPIWKCRKWVGRSKKFSEVNLNMVYGVPIWKQEKKGALRSEFVAIFCTLRNRGPLVGDFIYFHMLHTFRNHASPVAP